MRIRKKQDQMEKRRSKYNGQKYRVTFSRMDEEKENPPLAHVTQFAGTYLQEQDLLNISKILAECDPNTFEHCTSEAIDPVALGFIPKSSWTTKSLSLESLHESYFGRKNNVNRRFEHKLWNALRITSAHPNLIQNVGVCWVSTKIIKVYKQAFAKLLKIRVVDGGLFHKQGNFTRHGFVICNETKAMAEVPDGYLADVDNRNVVLIYHKDNAFNQNSTEETISHCKWDDPSPKTRVASLKITLIQPIE